MSNANCAAWFLLIGGLRRCTSNPPSQTISRFSVTVIAFDVGTRSRRRASQPRPGGVASRCLSRARLLRSASSARARTRREAQGFSAAPGCPSLWLLSLGQARESNPLPRGEWHLSGSGIAVGDSLPNPGSRLALETAPAFPVFPPSMAVTPE
jgi:hypothetical protein